MQTKGQSYFRTPEIWWYINLEILNAIIDVEQILPSLNLAITVPVYKGRGKDPLNTNSYRGITINSAISK